MKSSFKRSLSHLKSSLVNTTNKASTTSLTTTQSLHKTTVRHHYDKYVEKDEYADLASKGLTKKQQDIIKVKIFIT